jgi:hypothetical protein
MIRIAAKGERLMRKLVLAFLLTVPVANGQKSPRPVSVAKPDRTLTLLGRYEVIGERKCFYVAVVEHNITSHAIAAGRDIQPMSWYHMKVLRDGQPAPQKIMLKKYLEPRPAGASMLVLTCSRRSHPEGSCLSTCILRCTSISALRASTKSPSITASRHQTP